MRGEIVYKVVTKTRSGLLLSSYIGAYYPNDQICLEYKIGVPTTPKVGKIFCLQSLEDAKSFLDHYAGTTIYKARATNARPFKRLISVVYHEIKLTLEEFWKKRNYYEKLLKGKNNPWKIHLAPEGCMVCDSLELIEEVYHRADRYYSATSRI